MYLLLPAAGQQRVLIEAVHHCQCQPGPQPEARCNKHEGEIRRLAAATAVTLLLTSGSTRRLSSQVGAIRLSHGVSAGAVAADVVVKEKRREELFNLIHI